jgi:UDP-2-acetamido-3-amino-2,3-dideoxy-glucuronate N-acetyltransferase
VHPTAIVEDGSSIGDGTSVWHHSHVRSGAVIGSGCTLGKNVFIDSAAVVGNRVKIQNNVSVYSGVTLEDEVFVGPSAVFTNDLFPRAASTTWEILPTVVRRGASIGANATIICGNDIGEYAAVGSGSVVTRPVLAHQLVVGNPARHHGWVCSCGRPTSKSPERPADTRCDSCKDQMS